MSPLPDVRQVMGKPSGNDEQCIYPNIVAVAHVARSEPLGGDRDAAQAIAVQRPGGRFL